MWIVFPTQSGPAAAQVASSPLPTVHFSSFPILQTWVLTPPGWECPEEGEKKRGAGMFGLNWLCCELETAFSGPTQCLSAGVSFQESFCWVSGFHTGLSRPQLFDEGKCISISADHLLLPSAAPGNLEIDKESLPLLRSIHSSKWPSWAGPRWPRVFVRTHAHLLSRAWPMSDSQELLCVISLATLRASQQSCQHPLCPPPFSVNGWAACLPSTWFPFSETWDPAWRERPSRTLLPTRLEMWVHIVHPA